MELFVLRNDKKLRKKDDMHGWVDYWCGYRNTDIFIELKHGYISERSGQIKKDVQNKWEEAQRQINTIKEEVNNYSLIGKNGAVRIALMAMPIFKTVNGEEDYNAGVNHDELIKIQENVVMQLNPAPNWSGMWILHDDLDNIMEFSNATEAYSGIIFAAYVE
ncbi:hypothetical protein [Anaerosolibacter sp.]|uniref:hypothetical protein n=1 Tax=Anaerosolibacter sp. TaxID=1872527 RepID=UPI0039EDF509